MLPQWLDTNPKQEQMKSRIEAMIRYIGDDPDRPGLQETPARVVASWKELFSGYCFTDAGIANLLKTFPAEGCDEMVLQRDIPFYSTCEHHWLPFIGKAHIAYIPNDRIVGLSKLGRLLDVYSRRLQVQERMTFEIADALWTHLKPKGVGCIVEASHLCVACRGVKKEGSTTITSSLRGCFKKDPATRVELLQLVKG